MNNQLLAISLAIIMLSGSIPFSFAESEMMVQNTIQSPKKQLESGVLPEEIQCRENRVLVYRDDNRVACVKESTAEKKGWEIINDSQSVKQINYNFPLSSKQLKSSKNMSGMSDCYDNCSVGSSQFWSGDMEIILSSLPKLGETVDVTIKFTNDYGNDFKFFEKIIETDSTLELFSDTVDVDTNEFGSLIQGLLSDIPKGQTEIITLTMKALKEGEGSIGIKVEDGYAEIYMVVGSDYTLLLDDYVKLHPDFLAEDQIPEPEFPEGVISGGEESSDDSSSNSDPLGKGMTEEEIQAEIDIWMEDYVLEGIYTKEELAEIRADLERAYKDKDYDDRDKDPDAETQSSPREFTTSFFL